MFSKLEFFVALRYLKSRNREKFISVTAVFSFFGILLGVATLIVVMSVMNGFRNDFIERILGINSHISLHSIEKDLNDYSAVINLLKQNNNILFINPIIEEQVMISSEGNNLGAVIKGIELNDLKHKDKIFSNISAIDFDKDFANNGILLGEILASKLRVQNGDFIKIISPEFNSTIIGAIPRIKTYLVIGTFGSGMYEYDAGSAFIPLATAQKHFKYSNSVSAIEIYLKDVSKTRNSFYNISNLLKEENLIFNLVDWQNSNSAFIEALNIERNVMFIILTLIIIVATFNIISSLIMLVNDKTKQIALLRTIGFTKNSIMRIFIICGCMIGIVGTAVGTTLGILISTNISNIKAFLEKIFDVTLFSPTVYFLTELPSKILINDIIFIVSLSLILSLLSTIYPSYKASKTNPAEILRYE